MYVTYTFFRAAVVCPGSLALLLFEQLSSGFAFWAAMILGQLSPAAFWATLCCYCCYFFYCCYYCYCFFFVGGGQVAAAGVHHCEGLQGTVRHCARGTTVRDCARGTTVRGIKTNIPTAWVAFYTKLRHCHLQTQWHKIEK